MEISLAGKVALVTGAGPNIGSGIALALARYGAKVACNDIDPAAAQAAVKRIERNGGTAIAVPGDVTDEEQVLGYLRTVTETWGRTGHRRQQRRDPGRSRRAGREHRVLRAGRAGRRARQLPQHQARRALHGRTRHPRLDRRDLVVERLVRLGRGHRVRLPQGRGEQLRPGRGDGPGAVRDPGQQLHPDRAHAGQSRADRRAGTRRRAGPAAARVAWRAEGGTEAWRRPARWTGQRAPMVPMGTTGTPTDIGHCVAWMCSDYARLITGCDFVVDGGARARNFAYRPASPADLAGPVALDPAGRHR